MLHSKNFKKVDTNRYKYKKWVIHFQAGHSLDTLSIGSLIRIDLYNGAKLSAIRELKKFKLEKIQDGHTDLNGTREVNYYKILNPEMQPKCKDFKEGKKCLKCRFYDDRCIYLDSDVQLMLSGNEGDM